MSTSVRPEVVVAMSGGVDSSVAALLAVRDGLALAGVTLRLADAEDEDRVATGRCCAARDIRDARRVAARLDLPHYVVDMRKEFDEAVIAPFVSEYLAGRTPIPCVACNGTVKFTDLLARARALGAAGLVTGHYARLDRSRPVVRLLRAADPGRDQSYFLHGLTQPQAAATWFPLGSLTKAEVRRLAAEAGLPTADKPDSQEICFVPDGDAAAFVEREAARRGLDLRAGDVVDLSGRVLGRHAGVHRYTVGQRRGLGAHGAPVYALELDAATATVVAGTVEDLGCAECTVERFNWIAGAPPEGGPFGATVKVRHGTAEARALVVPEAADRARIVFERPARAVAPGQAAVVYLGDEVLGGGPISTSCRGAA